MYINVRICFDIYVYITWIYYTFDYLIDQRHTVTHVTDYYRILYIVKHGLHPSIIFLCREMQSHRYQPTLQMLTCPRITITI